MIVILTPDRRQSSRVCHVNMIKAHHDRNSGAKSSKSGLPCVSECEIVAVGLLASERMDEADEGPSRCIVQGRLNNSEMLLTLSSQLPHLTPAEKADVMELVSTFSVLFSDIPGQTSVIEYDIDVGFTPPIKPHPYRVNPFKRVSLQKEVEYMMENNIAEPSSSPWSSPCLLVSKSDGTFRF